MIARRNHFFTIGCSLLCAGVLVADEPRGDYAELHSCEVYTGGCTASAQATQGGRSVLRVWHFASGQLEGVDLAGLEVAVLEVADANLAMKGTESRQAVVYLPESVGPAQKEALLAWLKQNHIESSDRRSVPISYRREGSELAVKVGEGISFATREIERCDAGGCGEQLWYEPRGKVGAYTVLVNDRSQVLEPTLKLSWKDHSAKSVFFGQFGNQESPHFTLAALR